MKLSAIVPIYNEQADSVLELSRRVPSVPVDKEILVVDDDSRESPLPRIQKATMIVKKRVT